MDSKETTDFYFRYRPEKDSPDGILFGFLLSLPPKQRKYMILKALRAFYLIEAYGWMKEGMEHLQKWEQVSELVQLLNHTYADGVDGTLHHTLQLSIDIDVTYSGLTELPGDCEDEDDAWNRRLN